MANGRSGRSLLLAGAVLTMVLLGAAVGQLTRGKERPSDGVLGTLRTIELHGVGGPGCTSDCERYRIDTNFATRPGRVSQLAALVAGRVTSEGDLLFSGYNGTLVDAEGRLVADLSQTDPGLAIVAKRIRTGLFADFDNDGRNEILYGLNSYSAYSSSAEVRQRQQLSFEMLRTATDDPRDYVSVIETTFPHEECSGTDVAYCGRNYDWRIDGDIVDVAAADFDNDGWMDFAYLGVSLGDHSWIGFADDLLGVGVPLSNENGARLGVVLNRGDREPGVFSWSRETSPLEAYLKDLYPFSSDVNYAAKTYRLLAEDLDGDGNADLVAVGDKVLVAWGDGTGAFPSVTEIADTPGGTDAAIADLDRDGRLDVFVFANSEPRYIDVPLGTCVPQPACAERGRSDGGTSTVLLNDGGRTYRPFHAFEPFPQPTGASIIDADGDGWLDIILTCLSCIGPGLARAEVVAGRLHGYRIEPLAPGQGTETQMQRSAVLDVDDDGDLDVVFTGSGKVFRQLWINESTRSSPIYSALRNLVWLVFGVLAAALPAVLFAVRRRRSAGSRR